jgi:hypothetical protein
METFSQVLEWGAEHPWLSIGFIVIAALAIRTATRRPD